MILLTFVKLELKTEAVLFEKIIIWLLELLKICFPFID